ncbi:hypothetical protein [Actinomyces vulturis]|uniref:hypothetical protein n=1 Tax=Actinomyces vulturis TaxID=1857645 RepID=UPI0008296FEB|nr:hypothetical protein [Actinomyces vulturis]
MADVTPRPTFVYSQPDRDDPGLLVSTSGGVMLYRSIPMGPVTDARTDEDRLNCAVAMDNIFLELSRMVGGRIRRRTLLKNNYRQFHILSTVTDDHFHADPAITPSASSYNAEFGSLSTSKRTVLFGVPLIPTARRDTFKQAIYDIAEMLVEGGTTMDDFTKDRYNVGQAMKRSGLKIPTVDEIKTAMGWWNQGQWPDTINLPHGDHLHIFTSFSSAQIAQRAMQRQTECTTWGQDLPGHRVYTLACLDDTNLGWQVKNADDLAAWASRLHRGGAAAISIRGSVEPPDVTRSEMRRHRRQYEGDIRESQAKGKMDKAEAEQAAANLAAAENAYAVGGPPTLTQTRVTVAMDGQWLDPTTIGKEIGLSMVPRVGRQDFMLEETQLCSNVLENPHVKDWPMQMVSCSGIADVSIVGDGPSSPVILGFTENDRQAAGFTPSRAGDDDTAPFTAVVGATGSGKKLPLNTLLETPHGKIPLRLVKPGTTLLGMDGKPTRVTSLSDIDEKLSMRTMLFDTGFKQVSCVDHQWLVSDHQSRESGVFDRQPLLDTAKILHDGITDGSITTLEQASQATGLTMADIELNLVDDQSVKALETRLIERYNGVIGINQRLTTSHIEALIERKWAIRVADPLDVDNHLVLEDPHSYGRMIAQRGLGKRCVNTCGFGGNGISVATSIMRANISIRQSVYDAIAQENGGDVLRTAYKQTAQSYVQLAQTLGYKVYKPVYDGHVYQVRVDRTDKWIHIVDISHAPTVAGRCLSVDNDSHTYLIDGCLPTSNTMLLYRVSQLISRAGLDVISFGPKPMSSAENIVNATGGRLIDLSDLMSAEGIFDPLRYSQSIEAAVHQCATNILNINPWGTQAARGMHEVDLGSALYAGAMAGFRSTGGALMWARQNGYATPELVDPIIKAANSSPQFRSFVGFSNDGPTLSNFRGWTHIQVGRTPLDLPSEVTVVKGNETLSNRIALTLVRSVVNSCIFALQERGGTLQLDEAWTFMMAGPDELDRAGRLCREFGVDIIMYNQKVTEAINAGIEGYFSRGVILPVDSEIEAEAALRLFDKTLCNEDRLARLRAKATRGEGTATQPNWSSMRHLKDPDTGALLRGTIGFYMDLDGRFVPIEIVLPPSFLEAATTNAAVLRARRSAQMTS